MHNARLNAPSVPRRTFLMGAAAGLVAPAVGSSVTSTRGLGLAQESGRAKQRFKLHFAPHLGMFRHHAGGDPIDQLQFMADEGFTAFEDNGMAGREPALQERIGAKLDELGMKMGVFVAHANFGEATFVEPPAVARERIAADMHKAIEVAKRCRAKWCTVVPGAVRNNVPLEYQTANVIDNLRFAAELLEPAGLVAVLEPLNAWTDHPGLFLYGVPQAYLVCRAVNSSSVKILDDLYHQQITEGNLVRNIDRAWSEIAYVQVGDNPGRKEPGTGEINYRHVFEHLARKGFDGVVGMEHGNASPGKEGERAVIEAYHVVGGV